MDENAQVKLDLLTRDELEERVMQRVSRVFQIRDENQEIINEMRKVEMETLKIRKQIIDMQQFSTALGLSFRPYVASIENDSKGPRTIVLFKKSVGTQIDEKSFKRSKNDPKKKIICPRPYTSTVPNHQTSNTLAISDKKSPCDQNMFGECSSQPKSSF